MLTDNATLHLYRLQDSSQVLARLSGEWLPASVTHPTPTPTPLRTRAKTTLKVLAKQATPKGPHIKPSPCTPPDAPHWNGRVTTTLDTTPPDVQAAKATLLIFLNAALTNKGRQDDRPIWSSCRHTVLQRKRVGPPRVRPRRPGHQNGCRDWLPTPRPCTAE